MTRSNAQRTTTPPSSARIDRVLVVVPAHNEEAGVESTLSSLSVAARKAQVAVSCVVVLDACSDGTSDVVRRFCALDRAIDWSVITVELRRASAARSAGVHHAIRLHQGIDTKRVAVLSTDADTTVPSAWIQDFVERLNGGCDAVAGIVDLAHDAVEGFARDRWRDEYTASFRSDGSHAHVHGANLAVRLDALIAAGGFGSKRRAEDIDLWKRLTALKHVVVSSTQSSVVITSSRLNGRVTGGFATALQQFRRSELEHVAGTA